MSTTYYKDSKEYTYREALALTGANFKEVDKNIAVFIREGFVVVMPTPKPTPTTELKQVLRDGVAIDALGNTVMSWKEIDMFKDYADENGIVVTKLEQEADYLQAKFKATVPTVISMRQARLALLGAGLLSVVENSIISGTDEAMKIEWEYATEVRRDWESLIAMATVLGLTELDLDNLFIEGAKL